MGTTKPTSKITARVRELARDCYDEDGYCTYWEDNAPEGCYRRVIVDHEAGVVYKLARYSGYETCNRFEWDLYNEMSPSVQAMMAKPLAISSCGRVLAMELADKGSLYKAWDRGAWTGDFNIAHREFNDLLRETLLAVGVDENRVSDIMCDNHGNNIGVRANDSLCWIDYGCYGS